MNIERKTIRSVADLLREAATEIRNLDCDENIVARRIGTAALMLNKIAAAANPPGCNDDEGDLPCEKT